MDEKQQAMEFLIKKGWKVWQLADKAALPRGTIYRWIYENGRIFLDQWKKIEAVINNKQ